MSGRWSDVLLGGLYLALAVSGVLLIKLGLRGSELRFGNPATIVVTAPLLLGLAAYVASFALWIPVLARFDVSYIFPMLAGLAQVLLLVFSIWILDESPTRTQIAGALLVSAGVAMISLGTRS